MGIDRQRWLGLIIGNSRWHWAAFDGDRWLGTWHTPPLTADQVHGLQQAYFAPRAWRSLNILADLPSELLDAGVTWPAPVDLWLAAVVAAPLPWLASYPALHRVTTAQVPLLNTYPTLGVDRALALVGAGEVWGWPVLVIDCGTALTFTAGAAGSLVGGAIVPGVRSQFRALHTHTDQLPDVASAWPPVWPSGWPQRWATDTAEAIASGILHTQLAGIRDFIAAWEAEHPNAAVVITGGDSDMIVQGLKQQTPALAQRIQVDPELGFWGLGVCRRQQL